jgi:hypothetical protein
LDKKYSDSHVLADDISAWSRLSLGIGSNQTLLPIIADVLVEDVPHHDD